MTKYVLAIFQIPSPNCVGFPRFCRIFVAHDKICSVIFQISSPQRVDLPRLCRAITLGFYDNFTLMGSYCIVIMMCLPQQFTVYLFKVMVIDSFDNMTMTQSKIHFILYFRDIGII